MEESLKDRVALVTGASRGLGKAIAVELGRRGAKVAVNYFAGRENGLRVVEEIRQLGGRAEAFGGDVRDEAAVKRMIAEVEAKLGPVDILVVNATGDQPFIGVEDLDWQACLDQLEFFVKSPLLLTQAVLASMKTRRWGRIIMIGSEVFETAVPRFSAYVAAKGAQLGLTRSWSREFAEWGITVNLVAPGWIPTERHAGAADAEKAAYAAGVPMKRMGVPADVAAAVAFLASDDAAFVTGQKLSVNGGHTVE